MSKKKTRLLSAEEESALINDYLDNGNIDARNKLVIAYMPLATRAAQAFARRGTSNLQDLVQEAALALAQAIDNFDRKKKARLSTIAPFYIKASLSRYAMDFHGAMRIGTNLPDKRVFMNLRRMVAEVQERNGGQPITDADREDIARKLRVKVETVVRMEPRIFATDVAISHTDAVVDDDDGRTVTASGVISVEGEQEGVEVEMDKSRMMKRISQIIHDSYSGRDLKIVAARLQGDMTPERYAELVDEFNISVERIRQIQRGALAVIRDSLVREGITGMDMVAC